MGNFASFAKIFVASYSGKGIVITQALNQQEQSNGTISLAFWLSPEWH